MDYHNKPYFSLYSTFVCEQSLLARRRRSNKQSQPRQRGLFPPCWVSEWWTPTESGLLCGRASSQLWTSLICAHTRWCTQTPSIRLETQKTPVLFWFFAETVLMCECLSCQKALQEFALKHERSAELHRLPEQVYILDENAFFNDMRLGKKERKRLNINSALKKSLSFSLPGAKLSVDFFKEQVRVASYWCELKALNGFLISMYAWLVWRCAVLTGMLCNEYIPALITVMVLLN